MLKILFVPNWRVKKLNVDNFNIPAPDKILQNNKYWFFKYWDDINFIVDIIDSYSPFNLVEKMLKISIFQSMRVFFNQYKYDIIISHGSTSTILYLFLVKILNIKKPKFVLIDVGCFNRARNNKIELFFIRIAVKSIDFIIYHSSIQNNYYNKYLPSLTGKTKFIYFGIDEEDFMPYESRCTQKYLLSFGSYGRGRDYETLLNAWQNIEHKNYKLIILGIKKTPKIFKKYILKDVDLIDSVSIIKLKEYIMNADIIILPLPIYNHSYGQMSFLQTMSLAKPLIISKVPSDVDYLTNELDCLMVEPFDVADLENKIKKLLNCEELKLLLSSNARKTIINKYTEKEMANNLLSVIKDVLKYAK